MFSKYLGIIAELNRTYKTEHTNFLVIGGGQPNTQAAVTLQNNGETVKVNIIGIQKAASELCETIKTPKFRNFLDAVKKAQNDCGLLIFGKSIIEEELKQVKIAGSEIKKIYVYLETLNSAADAVKAHQIQMCFGDDAADDERLVELLSAWGLLCSGENENYITGKCKLRTFDNGKGSKEFYNVHLKPVTYPENTLGNLDAVRIYLAWDDAAKTLRIGYIGKHPDDCFHCPRQTKNTCPGAPK
jgi:hypothetical protein